MQVHLYALCWNDADMLPFFFQHYDPLVSQYFIFDDHSSDGSLDLMRAHPNVEVEPFVRSDPDSFTLSELSISNECWKRSRGSADWVLVIDIDEHLFHPDLSKLLMRYKALGISIVPALGYQMISDEFPGSNALLCAVGHLQQINPIRPIRYYRNRLWGRSSPREPDGTCNCPRQR
jgi:Glycosyl transferase family 2